MRRAGIYIASACVFFASMGMAGCTSHPAAATGPPAAAAGDAPQLTAQLTAQLTTQLTTQAWTTQQSYAAAAIPFELLGKVGMPRGSANIRWRQAGEQFDLRLWGPFGAGTAIIHGDASAIRFERDGLERVGDPAEILSHELGWSVPVGALSYWVRGLPAPMHAATAFALRDGRLAHVEQAGWSIDIDRYQQQSDGGWLPARLIARQADVRFTLVVQSWTYGAARAAASPESAAGAPAPSSVQP